MAHCHALPSCCCVVDNVMLLSGRVAELRTLAVAYAGSVVLVSTGMIWGTHGAAARRHAPGEMDQPKGSYTNTCVRGEISYMPFHQGAEQ